jgi:hypothetical protein
MLLAGVILRRTECNTIYGCIRQARAAHHKRARPAETGNVGYDFGRSRSYAVGSWLRNPAGSQHMPFSLEGCLLYVKIGHLPTVVT